MKIFLILSCEFKISCTFASPTTKNNNLKHNIMEQNITINNIESLVGKTIKWTSPRSSDNARYGDYTGVALIKAYVPGDYRPIKVETISGDSLEYAFLSRDKFYFAYSDDDCGIGFEIVKEA